jgi:DNA-binding response OmpR family regulator
MSPSVSLSLSAKILVVDDDPLILTIIEHKLRARGHLVRTADDGAAGLAQAQAFAPDLVVLDMMMPVLDGWEMLRALRQDPVLRRVPVVMLTARRSEDDMSEAFDLGVSDYIAKPFNPAELVARVDRLLPQVAAAS